MINYRYLTYSIVLTLLGFGIWIGLKDHDAILRSIQQIGWLGFLWICSLSLFNYLLRYLRWVFLLGQLGDRFPFMGGLVCYISGFALTTTPGKAGESIRSLYFGRRYQIATAHTLAALFSERASDALTGVVLSLFAFYTFENTRWLGVGLTAAIIVFVLLIKYPVMLLKIPAMLCRINFPLVQKLVDLIPVFVARAADLLSIRALGIGLMIALVSWSAEAFGFAWLAQQLGGQASAWLYMSIFAVAMLAGAATFLPGGLGGTEAVMYVLLKVTGMSDSDAITIALLCRLATLWFAVVLGVISMLWLENNVSEPVTE